MFISAETAGERHLWMFPPECLSIPQIHPQQHRNNRCRWKKGPTDCSSVWGNMSGPFQATFGTGLTLRKNASCKCQRKIWRWITVSSHTGWGVALWLHFNSACMTFRADVCVWQTWSASSSMSKAISLVFNNNSGQTACEESRGLQSAWSLQHFCLSRWSPCQIRWSQSNNVLLWLGRVGHLCNVHWWSAKMCQRLTWVRYKTS